MLPFPFVARWLSYRIGDVCEKHIKAKNLPLTKIPLSRPDVNMETVEENLKAENEASGQQIIAHPSLGEAFKFWLKLGFISFGGPAGQISIMHHELVEQKKWIRNDRFFNMQIPLIFYKLPINLKNFLFVLQSVVGSPFFQ